MSLMILPKRTKHQFRNFAFHPISTVQAEIIEKLITDLKTRNRRVSGKKRGMLINISVGFF